jgi:hypothetical protein
MADRDPSQYFWRNRWNATDNPAGASAATVTAPAFVVQPTQRPHLETIIGSIWSGGGGATVAVQVRIASAAGTMVASLDNNVASSTVAQINLVSLGLPGKRGQKFWVSYNTAVASLTTKVAIAGWIEDVSG